MKRLSLRFLILAVLLTPCDLVTAQSGRLRAPSPTQETTNVVNGSRTIEGVVTGVLPASSNATGKAEIVAYSIIIRVGELRYRCRVDPKPPPSLFGKSISHQRDLMFLYGKQVRASLRASGIRDLTVSEKGSPNRTIKEGYGDLIKLVVLDAPIISSVSASSAGRTLTVEEEALERGKDFWFSRFKKCGDSIYLKSAQFPNDKRWEQFQGVRMNVQLNARTLSPANRANGYEWIGDAELVFQGQGLARTYLLQSNGMQWTEWYDFHPRRGHYSITLTKKNGSWTIDTHENVIGRGYGVKSGPIDCAEVPQ